ncbi:MAG TPA: spermidine/putrescine ABC transporter substrate-binding protein [Solirubrobacterales bacterium]|nr:spermidine/putrescine ABC transporter substrate-binding protein [Solirubrobacterales bacterium]
MTPAGTKNARPSKRVALAALGLVGSLVLVACGDSGLNDSGSDDVSTAEAEGEASGDLTISNWPFYIDKETIPNFEEETGITVDYTEDVNDNNQFFGKVQPQLENGEAGGRDIMVVTDWMAKKMYDLGYLQNLDQDAIEPAKANLVGSLESPDFDPEREFSMPWQAGMTGLVVNTAEAPDVTSVNDLFEPEYEGKVEMLTEMRDTVPLVMKADGVDPADATTEDWLAAIDKIGAAAESGQIRKFTGNDYTRDLANGDVVAVIGWSGDAVQLQADNPDIQFVMPDEGCMIWGDNMVIPVGAPNPTAAYEWMNYVYEPENQAQIADYNYYLTPVDGTQEVLEEQGSDAAESDLVFPEEEFTADCSTQVDPPGDEEEIQEVEQAFQDVITGA